MRRLLVDASTLIALSTCGRLNLLRKVGKAIATTAAVPEEVLVDRPGSTAIREAIDAGWIKVIKVPPTEGKIAGVGRGEASLIAAAKAGDILVLDDRSARLEARSRGLPITGLLGLIVHGARTRRLDRQEARLAIDDLAKGNFRMSADLYRWALEGIGTA